MRIGARARRSWQLQVGLLLALTTAVLGSYPPPQSFAQSKAYMATGRAKLSGKIETAQRRSLENALWLAVEQAVHAVVPAGVRAEHAPAISTVLARPRQYVTGYEVIQRGPSRGYFIVRVKASVAMAPLVARLQALAVPVARPAPDLQPTQVASAPAPSAAQPAPGPTPAASPQQSAPQPTPAPAPAISQAPPPAAAQVQPQPERLRIALIPFQLGFTNPQFTQSWDVSHGVTDLVEEALFSTGRYRLVERRQLEQVLREQGLGGSGALDPATVARVGRVLGVRRFVTGSVNQFDLKGAGGIAISGIAAGLYRAQVELAARVIDTTTAEIVGIVRGTGRAEGVLVFAYLQGLAFGGAEFKNSVLGKALDQAVQELVGKLNTAMGQ